MAQPNKITVTYLNAGVDYWPIEFNKNDFLTKSSVDIKNKNFLKNAINQYMRKKQNCDSDIQCNINIQSNITIRDQKIDTVNNLIDKTNDEQVLNKINYDIMNFLMKTKKIRKTKLMDSQTQNYIYSCDSKYNTIINYQKENLERTINSQPTDLYILSEFCWKNRSFINQKLKYGVSQLITQPNKQAVNIDNSKSFYIGSNNNYNYVPIVCRSQNPDPNQCILGKYTKENFNKEEMCRVVSPKITENQILYSKQTQETPLILQYAQIIVCRFLDEDVIIINVHHRHINKQNKRSKFYSDLKDIIDICKTNKTELLVIGDFNAAANIDVNDFDDKEVKDLNLNKDKSLKYSELVNLYLKFLNLNQHNNELINQRTNIRILTNFINLELKDIKIKRILDTSSHPHIWFNLSLSNQKQNKEKVDTYADIMKYIIKNNNCV